MNYLQIHLSKLHAKFFFVFFWVGIISNSHCYADQEAINRLNQIQNDLSIAEREPDKKIEMIKAALEKNSEYSLAIIEAGIHKKIRKDKKRIDRCENNLRAIENNSEYASKLKFKIKSIEDKVKLQEELLITLEKIISF